MNTIPKVLYKTGSVEFENLHKCVLENFKKTEELNPDIKIEYYDDSNCIQFIETYFEQIVVHSFNALIPGAYKADLFRYCVLYEKGGIYSDLTQNFNVSLNEIINFDNDSLVLVEDIRLNEYTYSGIQINFMAARPKLPIFKTAIWNICKNIRDNIYGKTCLEPTGPYLFRKCLNYSNIKPRIELVQIVRDEIPIVVFKTSEELVYYNKLQNHNEYLYNPQTLKNDKTTHTVHYSDLWNERNIYDTSIQKMINTPINDTLINQVKIHKKDMYHNINAEKNNDFNNDFKFIHDIGNIYNAFEMNAKKIMERMFDKKNYGLEMINSKNYEYKLPVETNYKIPKVIRYTFTNKQSVPQEITDSLQKYASDYEIKFYSDNDCIYFLREYYGEMYVKLFNSLKIGAHKADLFRYCVLYAFGGIYIDVKLEIRENFKTIFDHCKNKLLYTCLGTKGKDETHFQKQIRQHLRMHNGHIFQAIIATYPRNPIFKKLISDFFVIDVPHTSYDVFTQRFYDYIVEDLGYHPDGGNIYKMKSNLLILFNEKEVEMDGNEDRYGGKQHIFYKTRLLFRSRYPNFPWNTTEPVNLTKIPIF
tara:strand:+ start:969 stop:2732 length:1764 start_codon:yes stop_codon:yes gene_type:complete